MFNRIKSIFGLFLLSALSLNAQSAFPDITHYSIFKSLDQAKLEKGEILSERGEFNNFSRGLTVEFAYVINQPVELTAKGLAFWNPPIKEDSIILASHIFTSDENADFNQFDLNLPSKPINSLVQQTLDARNKTPTMQLSKTDLENLKKTLQSLPPGAKSDSPEAKKIVSQFWAALLQEKYTSYRQKGLSAIPGYQLGDTELIVEGELKSLLSEYPQIYTRFKELLITSIILPAGKVPSPATSYYWQVIKADKIATCVLGVVNSKQVGKTIQIADSQIYVSNSYFTTLTLYELYPVTINGKECTFVWRSDFVSAPLFEYLKGVQQFAAGALMIKSIKQSIGEFKRDIESGRQESFATKL
ncbi:MAG: hypothetical protein SGI98_08265 [Verrucomicrobiota bacterium]|nr:hypothetical protein [Verrucomicrobiota bacterium]